MSPWSPLLSQTKMEVDYRKGWIGPCSQTSCHSGCASLILLRKHCMRQTSTVIFVHFLTFPQDYKCAVSMGMESGLLGFRQGEIVWVHSFVTFSLLCPAHSLSLSLSLAFCNSCHGTVTVLVLLVTHTHTNETFTQLKSR